MTAAGALPIHENLAQFRGDSSMQPWHPCFFPLRRRCETLCVEIAASCDPLKLTRNDPVDAEDNDLAQLRRAVLNDPRNGSLRYLLGAEMAQQRDYEGAVLEMSAAIALDPYLYVARFQLGLLHLTLGQPQHAVAVLAPLEELEDGSALKHFKRGLEALIKDEFSSCLLSLQQGIELNTDNAPLNRDMTLIVDRVKAVVNEQQSAASAQTDSGAQGVRTDFSLYGLTKH